MTIRVHVPDQDEPLQGLTSLELRELLADRLIASGMDPAEAFHVAGTTAERIRQDRAAYVDAPAPLFDPEEFRFGRFLLSEPPPRRWVLRDFLPLGITGLLGAMGGAGKSAFIYQMGFSVATGDSFMGMEVGEPGSFLYLASEDDEGELHRRGRTILGHLDRGPGGGPDRDLLAERMFIVPRVGEDNRLTAAGPGGEVYHTQLVDQLLEAARSIRDLRLVVVDPISRFMGGNPDQSQAVTPFTNSLEQVSKATGATVLGLTHLNKAGIKEGGGQEMIRHSSALVDGARWVATLQPLRQEKARDYGVADEEAGRYLRLDVPKTNYTAPFPGQWMYREAGGFLVPAEIDVVKDARKEQEAEREYLATVGLIQDHIRSHGPATARALRDMAGLSGPFAVGDHKLRAIIARAARDGSLIERQSGRATTLHTPSASLSEAA